MSFRKSLCNQSLWAADFWIQGFKWKLLPFPGIALQRLNLHVLLESSKFYSFKIQLPRFCPRTTAAISQGLLSFPGNSHLRRIQGQQILAMEHLVQSQGQSIPKLFGSFLERLRQQLIVKIKTLNHPSGN